MKEFFLNHICTTPNYTSAVCEHQYQTLTTFGVIILVGYAITLAVTLVAWRMGGLTWRRK